MEVTQTLDALRTSARQGQLFPRWWYLSDPVEQAQVRAYCQGYTPFYRRDTWGSSLTRQVRSFTLPQPRNQNVTEASCNAIGFALLDQLGMGLTAKRTSLADKENRLPYYFDLSCVELIVLDGVAALLQRGTTETRLRKREVLWLLNLFHRPSYQRPESTGITRILGDKQGLSIPVVILGDSTICHLLDQMEVAVTLDSDQTPPLELAGQANKYGPSAEAGTLTFQDLNQLRAYLRLPRLQEGTVQLQAYNTNHIGEPAFGIATWEGRTTFFSTIEHSVDEAGQEARPTRYVLLEATDTQIEESIKRHHRLHPSELRKNAVLGWFQRDALAPIAV